MEFQKKVYYAGIKSPKPYIAVETDNKDKFIIMERIKGMSVQEMIDDINKIPEGFDIDIFSKKLKSLVEKMNKERMHHRDLHAG